MLYRVCGVFFLLFVIFLSPGCKDNREEYEKKIVAFDPSFREDLKKRDILKAELVDQKSNLFKFKREVAFKINELKKEEVRAKRQYEANVEKIKLQINPFRRRLRQDLDDKRRLYKSKRTELSDVEKDIGEITALMEKKDRLVLTQEEVRTWNDRLSVLIERKADLAAEIENLKKDIEIMDLKIKVMRL